MLDPWIIDEIRRREERRGHRAVRPVLELPVKPPEEDEPRAEDEEAQEEVEEGECERGVTVIDFSV